MAVSILHRAAGQGMAFVGLPVLLWFLAAVAGGAASYATFAEHAGSWYGMLAPAGIQMAVRDRLATEIAAIVKAPDVSSKIVALGWSVVGNTPAEFAAFMRAELDRYGKVVKARGITIDNP